MRSCCSWDTEAGSPGLVLTTCSDYVQGFASSTGEVDLSSRMSCREKNMSFRVRDSFLYSLKKYGGLKCQMLY